MRPRCCAAGGAIRRRWAFDASKTIASRALLASRGACFDDEMTSLRLNDEMTLASDIMARGAVIEGEAEVMRRQARHR